jgi:predicted DNA-binding transcriptional regulator AlpA
MTRKSEVGKEAGTSEVGPGVRVVVLTDAGAMAEALGETAVRSVALLHDDRLLTRAEMVDLLGFGRRFLDIAATRGDGPPMVRIGRSVFYRCGDVRAWIAARRVTSTSEDVAADDASAS